MFIPNVYIIALLILIEGLLGGGAYANAFYMIQSTSEPVYREYRMGSVAVADAAGISLAGVTSMLVEPYIKRMRGMI